MRAEAAMMADMPSQVHVYNSEWTASQHGQPGQHGQSGQLEQPVNESTTQHGQPVRMASAATSVILLGGNVLLAVSHDQRSRHDLSHWLVPDRSGKDGT